MLARKAKAPCQLAYPPTLTTDQAQNAIRVFIWTLNEELQYKVIGGNYTTMKKVAQTASHFYQTTHAPPSVFQKVETMSENKNIEALSGLVENLVFEQE